MNELLMHELAEELGYSVVLEYPNFVPMYVIRIITDTPYHTFTNIATLETVDAVIDWLLDRVGW